MVALFAWGPSGWGDELLLGAWLTLQLAAAGLFFGLLLAALLAFCKHSRWRLLRVLARGWSSLLKGIPEFLIILLIFFGGDQLLRLLGAWIGIETTIEINRFVAGAAALAIIFSAFAADVLYGAYQAVPSGQNEAAAALGMKPWQNLYRIRLPQMWRFALPGLSNLWLVLLKDSSMVSVIALNELLRQANIAAEVTQLPFVFYFVAALIYLLLTGLSDLLRKQLEQGANRGLAKEN